MPARRSSRVEATKFTEVGYVGRDVEQIVRDLVEISIALTRDKQAQGRAGASAELAAEERVLDALVGPGSGPATRESFRKKLRAGELNDKEIEIEVQAQAPACRCSKSPACRARRWAPSISATSSASSAAAAPRRARSPSRTSHDILVNEESDKLLDNEQLVQESIKAVEQNGIVFLDEIDKIAGREGRTAPTCRARACSATCCR